MSIARDIAPEIVEEVIKLRERTLLEGAMAASALVAMADRRLKVEESLALGSVLENVEALRIHDPHLAIDLYGGFVDGMRTDFAQGRDQALAAVARCADDLEAAELLVKVGIAVAKADNEFQPEEVEVVGAICERLGIVGLDPNALVGKLKPNRAH
ncbi:MAG: TerB family tellurite resistance protein [Myxococcota bacterium]